MPALERLVLRQNLITKLEGLENVPKLQHLDVYDNCIEKLENINQLKELKFVRKFVFTLMK